MSRRWTALAGFSMASCFTTGWFLQRELAASGDVYQQARLFEQVLAHVRDYHVDSLAESELYRRATDGLLGRLRDPYAALLTGTDLERHVERTTGDYVGVGLLVDARNGWVTVVAPMHGSPAERAGLRPGDRLFEVDGASAADWTLDDAVQTMRGPPGTAIDLAVLRDGLPQPLRFRLLRERIHRRAVLDGLLLGDGVGYLSMTMVRHHAAGELEREVAQLLRRGMRLLLLDLRSNPGGLRDEAVEIADLFLDPGQEILVSKGRAPGDDHRWTDRRRQRWPELPIVVLVDGGTASAGEIIAGALQDHDRALIVGDTTFGKGVVQTIFPLASDVALRMTTARWYTPSGRSIQAAVPDSMGDGPAGVVVSAGGRSLPASGGLVPDVVFGPDSLTADESRFVHSLAERVPVFRDVLTDCALEVRNRGLVKEEAFGVTPAMRSDLRRRLVERGVVVADSVFTRAAGMVDRQLGYEIARYAFGLAAERRRRVADDSQIRRAIELVRGATSPRALMGLLPGDRPTPGH